MEPFVLKDKAQIPTSDVLRVVLKNSFPAYEQLEKELADTGTSIEWRYYNDGKASRNYRYFRLAATNKRPGFGRSF